LSCRTLSCCPAPAVSGEHFCADGRKKIAFWGEGKIHPSPDSVNAIAHLVSAAGCGVSDCLLDTFGNGHIPRLELDIQLQHHPLHLAARAVSTQFQGI